MVRVFRAQKMLDRVMKDPELAEMLDDKTIEFIKKLDGKKGNDYNWASVVNGENLVLIKKDEDLDEDVYVNADDCD